jgi:D-3-phosphoglycerate dehydrogenase / 2-oxoglutarate reductase
MSNSVKRVFYVRYVADPSYIDILARRPDVRLDKLDNDGDDSVAAPILAAAHAYQIGSARDEIAPKYYAAAPLLARMPNLLVVSTSGAGYDTVDLKDCTAAGVLVVNQAGGNCEAVAQHVLGMLLCLAKRIVEADRALRSGTLVDRTDYKGRQTQGRTIGIVGLGNVGRRVAELTGGMLGMQVIAYDPYLSADEMAARGAAKVPLDELLRRSEFVSINCPLTDETRSMIGARELALMPRHAYLITTARGFIHDETALLDALRTGRLAGAGLDVWDKEPPPPDHPLLQLDNVIASPHTAGVTGEARVNMGRIAAEQMLACLDGKRPPRLLNPEVWPRYARRFARAFGFAPEGELVPG